MAWKYFYYFSRFDVVHIDVWIRSTTDFFVVYHYKTHYFPLLRFLQSLHTLLLLYIPEFKISTKILEFYLRSHWLYCPGNSWWHRRTQCVPKGLCHKCKFSNSKFLFYYHCFPRPIYIFNILPIISQFYQIPNSVCMSSQRFKQLSCLSKPNANSRVFAGSCKFSLVFQKY